MNTNDSQKYRGWLSDFYKEKRYEEALDLVLKEEKESPNVFEVLQAKTSLLGLLGRYEEAVTAASLAIILKEDDHIVHHMQGTSLYYLKKYTEAIKSFDAVLKICPNYYRSIELKISSLILVGKYADAIRLYEESDLPFDGSGVSLNNLGMAYIELNNYGRAGSCLYIAKIQNPFEPFIYYNLARVHRNLKDYKRFIKHLVAFITLYSFKKLGINKNLSKHATTNNFTVEELYFDGPGKLYKSDSETRELKSILKILRGMNAAALCNDTWQWFAVNIPYEAINKNGVKGDIDIILKRPRYFGKYDAGFTYRGFQVKTVIVSQFDLIKSAKRGKDNYHKIKKQLNVLKKFGCEQIFLLEIFVLERGYSHLNRFPSDKIKKEIIAKANYLGKLGYGYVVMAEEPSVTQDDESGGIAHLPINVLTAESNSIGPEFQKLVDGIDTFVFSPLTTGMLRDLNRQVQIGVVTGYCRKCESLTMLIPNGYTSHVCGKCKTQAY